MDFIVPVSMKLIGLNNAFLDAEKISKLGTLIEKAAEPEKEMIQGIKLA
jgi:hypothetical protein